MSTVTPNAGAEAPRPGTRAGMRQAYQIIAPELARTLNQARVALEESIEGRSPRQALERCADQLHEGGGALKLAEVYGGALLAEEMEFTCRFLITGKREQATRDDGLDALTRAMVQLPAYLERVQASGRDIALVLLPMLNDLRTVRGQPLLSESTILLLNRTPSSAVTVSHRGADPSEDFVQLSRKVRPAFQLALLGILKSDGTVARPHLKKLLRMAEAFEAAAARDDVYRLWWVVSGVLETLIDGGLPLSVSVKRLLGQADRRIKRTIDDGIGSFDEDPVTDLLNSLLFYIARAERPGDKVLAIREAFGLSDPLPSQSEVDDVHGAMARPSVALMQTVAAAIREDLGAVKDVLDIHVRTGETDVTRLRPQVELLAKISDTLGVLGLGEQRGSVLAEVDRLQAMIDADDGGADTDVLMTIAATLLKVEASLERRLTQLVAPSEESPAPEAPAANDDLVEVRGAVMRECIVNLARIKDTLTQVMQGKVDAVAVDAVPTLADGIASGFRMLELQRAASVFERLTAFVRVYLNAANQTLANDHQDRLADALVSIEYYMETIAANRREPGYMLDNAETCLLVLDELRVALTQPRDDVTATQVTASPNFGAGPQAVLEDGTEVITSPVVGGDSTTIDPELLELFIEEAKEEVRTINRLLPRWQTDTGDVDALITVRRSFHTLKGSGRMVGAERIGEYCWHLENLLNRLINRTLNVTPPMVEFIVEAAAAVPGLIEQLEVSTPPTHDVDLLTAKAQAFAEGDPDAASLTRSHDLVANPPLEMDPVLLEIFAKEAAGHMAEIGAYLTRAVAPAAVTDALYRACHTLHGSINTAGLERATPLSGVLNQMVRRVHDGGGQLDVAALKLIERAIAALGDTIRAVNTSAEPIGIEPLVGEIEKHIELLVHEQTQRLTPPPVDSPATHAKTEVLPPLASQGSETALSESPNYDPEIAEIFTEEAGEVLEQVDSALERWNADRDPLALSELKRYLHTLKGSANMAGIGAFGDLSHELETLLIALDDERITANSDIDDLLRRCIDCLHGMRDTVLDGRQPAPREDLGGTVRLVALGEPVPAVEDVAPPPPERGFSADEMVAIPADDASAETVGADVTQVGLESDLLDADALFATDDDAQDVDADAITIASDALLGDDKVTSAIPVDPFRTVTEQDGPLTLDEHAETQQVTRDAFGVLEDAQDADTSRVSLDFQFDDDALQPPPEPPIEPPPEPPVEPPSNVLPFSTDTNRESEPDPSDTLIERSQLLEALIDDAAARFSQESGEAEYEQTIASDAPIEPDEEDTALVQALVEPPDLTVIDSRADVPEETPPEETDVAEAAEGLTGAAAPADAVGDVPGMTGAVVNLPTRGLPTREPVREKTEFARVNARLLEEMLNAAGEISIYHGRLSQQVSSVDFHLAELAQTVTRLRDQLRQMEIETEAQILNRHEEDRERRDFDPLELDRYSKIQQLSRALAETSNDVDSLKDLLQAVTTEADSLLTQQSRVTAELQNGLMRTRMVPFERHVARLSRLVRQSAAETGKQAELAVEGASGELDRQVLEKMLPPLEHMMRNAVVHGIEPPAERQVVGKPPAGQVTIRLHREGSEMVMDVADDGRGLDIEVIRRKGIERGLIRADASPSDEAIMELILEPGFSTAAALTQAAGRGVGMDVVANEVKRLGGSLRMTSLPGQGTNFTIRLPFTLALTQALIVRAGDEVYALPLPTVEGVTRVPRSEIEGLLEEAEPTFDYGEHTFRLRHLGPLVGGAAGRLADDEQSAVPIILIRAGQHSTALLVDEMLASREIVVKAVGPQISGITGVTGATILGDGRVVLILDLPSLVRLQQALPSIREHRTDETEQPLVLVVDDSITVRRVTERFLKRNGFRVQTARDGLDAVSVIQEHSPDIILLDIEMPRMDGFEFATHVRNDVRYASTPIIMITSRSGDKHRARAIEIGVNDYLGKPYQDHQLLDSIRLQLDPSGVPEDT